MGVGDGAEERARGKEGRGKKTNSERREEKDDNERMGEMKKE